MRASRALVTLIMYAGTIRLLIAPTLARPVKPLNSVPYSQFAKEAANHTTPNYAYISPNLQHDAHDGPPSAADSWLSQNVPTILALPEFQPGGDGILFIVWEKVTFPATGFRRTTAAPQLYLVDVAAVWLLW